MKYFQRILIHGGLVLLDCAVTKVASTMAYQTALDNNRVKLERALPMNRLVPYLHPVGLMGDTKISQELNSNNTDAEKTRLFLNWLGQGISIGNTVSFDKFMKAMDNFAKDNRDDTVAFLLFTATS